MAPSFPSTPLARLEGHNGPVHAVTFSAGTGQYVLTGAQDRQIRLFNPASGRLIQSYRAHGHEVLDLAVSADNARFASVGGDKPVFLWDVASATTLRRFAGHAARVNAVAFAADEDAVLVSGSFDGTVKLWDLRARGERPIMSLSDARDSVSSVAVRGAEVLVGSVDGVVRAYDLAAGCVDADCVAPRVGVTSVDFTAAGDAYLASSLDSTVRLMDRPTGKCLQTFRDPASFRNVEYRVRSCLAMGDACALSGSENGCVVIWDVLTGDVIQRVWHRKEGQEAGSASKRDVVSAVAWNQLRKQWASADGDGSVVVWGVKD